MPSSPLSQRYEEAIAIAAQLIEEVRQLSKAFPEEEDMGMVVHIRDAVMELHKAVMMAGTADHRQDFLAYSDDARGKVAVLHTHLELALELGYCSTEQHTTLAAILEQLSNLIEPPTTPNLTLVN